MNDLSGKIYTMNGEFLDTSETHEGKRIFRKMTSCKCEFKICKILIDNPHQNIVTIYKCNEPVNKFVRKSCIDMEFLHLCTFKTPIIDAKK